MKTHIIILYTLLFGVIGVLAEHKYSHYSLNKKFPYGFCYEYDYELIVSARYDEFKLTSYKGNYSLYSERAGQYIVKRQSKQYCLSALSKLSNLDLENNPMEGYNLDIFYKRTMYEESNLL